MVAMIMKNLQILAFCLGIQAVSSFLAPPSRSLVDSPSRLSVTGSISEWRDLMFDYPGTGNDRRLGTEQGAPPRQVNILPFPFDQILLQGETKQLRLYEDRFIKLFQDTMDNHCGVVAMGLMAQAGIVQKVPLCEIEAYNRMDNFGIFVTIRVVGRAELMEVTQQEPYIQAVCMEISDKVPPNLELPNLLAKNIEDSIDNLSKMEQRLKQVQDKGDKSESGLDRAVLEDRFYEEIDEDDDDDDDEDDQVTDMSRQQRFLTAYRTALATDTQGYFLASADSSYGKTPQELTAISWAGFCTDIVPDMLATYRIQALDSVDLFERLKLASQMMKQKEKQLKAELVKAGLEPGDGGDSATEGDKQ
ncbi:ATP-dependent protease La (LON) domain [Seminavis robusta]|uniref:ATP-dependent protease La (LON) domain n=1 Tax=Seminavis robusta TaxID=568900 RepID=A0A9N8E414_9STRA|nr:ATP-dependent protease La (LON) domain [Seminavis robusta]|eukprot:Sro480_g151390.1 ATP-dependent protease La (LON) domain (361) ;mRNA; f:31964-33188